MAIFSSDAQADHNYLNGNRPIRNGHAQTASLDRVLADEPTIRAIVLRLCGEPNERLSSKSELRFGTHGSLSIDLGKAVFFDHENDKGGGILDLIKLNLRCDAPRGFWMAGKRRLPAESRFKQRHTCQKAPDRRHLQLSRRGRRAARSGRPI